MHIVSKRRVGKVMIQPIFQIKHLNFTSNNQIILDDISFDILPGEIVTITGPSGGGKSTLLKMMGNIINPTSGEIFYKGTPIEKYDPIEYRKKVSYFFQNAQLFDQTVRDNLAFPYEIRNQQFDQERATRSLAQVQLSKSYLDKPIRELSGGERQRVGFIRNLQFQPNELLLDEVTSSLDKDNREIVLNLIHQLNQEEQLTSLMITHNQSEIDQSSRVIYVTQGKVEVN